MKQSSKQDAAAKTEQNLDEADDDEDFDDEEIEEEVEEEVEEEEDEDEDGEAMDQSESPQKSQAAKSSSTAQQSSSTNAGSQSKNSNAATGASQNTNASSDKRPRLTDELYEMNLRRKKEHVGSALYIPFPRKVSEEEVRAFVGQGPNIFLVGIQKLNAIVRYRTQTECEKQQKELAKKEFDGQLLNIEPKTVKIDPANIDVKTLIVQYSNPDLTIMDFAQIFIKAISISLKGGKGKKESGQDDLSFGSAIIIFPSHEEAKEAFLATENLNIKGEQLRVVFADFRPVGQSSRPNPGSFNTFRKSGDGGNRGGNFSRGGGNNNNARPGQGGGGGNYNRQRNRNSGGQGQGQGGGVGGGQGGGNRNFNNNRSVSYNTGGVGGGGGSRNYSPNKKFRSNS